MMETTTSTKTTISKTGATVERSLQEMRAFIVATLDTLPADSVQVVEQFVSFLHEQAQQGQPVVAVKETAVPYSYPTVALPASALDRFTGLLTTGYEGDALADSESLYDDA